MTAEFTPGPWSAAAINSWNVWARDCKVANMSDVGQGSQYRDPSKDERIANAHLIAAAPDLYEALMEVLARCSISKSGRAVGEAALAKARGEA